MTQRKNTKPAVGKKPAAAKPKTPSNVTYGRGWRTAPPKPAYKKSVTITATDSLDDAALKAILPGDTLRLAKILTYRRPDNSSGEVAMLNEIVLPALRNAAEHDPNVHAPSIDSFGNIIVLVEGAPDDGTVMFTAHTDTVHYTGTPPNQPVHYDAIANRLFVDSTSDCLGADDGTGVWLMLNMIEASVPGIYAFFRAEETGRNGSKDYMTRELETLQLAGITQIISFDRKGTSDIVATQCGSPCCSTEFQQALADALNAVDSTFAYKPGARGSFTDSATFMHEIAECTNIAVGYYDQHSYCETQDVEHAHKLCEALKKVNWSTLPTVRDPKYVPPKPARSYGGYGGYGGTHDIWDDYDLSGFYDDNKDVPFDTSGETNVAALRRLVEAYPVSIAALLSRLGYTPESLCQRIGVYK